MTRKLLKKSRNRFLQQQLPENLIPNKSIQGKFVQKFKIGFDKQSHVYNQWVFSWNELEKKKRKNQHFSNSFSYENTLAREKRIELGEKRQPAFLTNSMRNPLINPPSAALAIGQAVGDFALDQRTNSLGAVKPPTALSYNALGAKHAKHAKNAKQRGKASLLETFRTTRFLRNTGDFNLNGICPPNVLLSNKISQVVGGDVAFLCDNSFAMLAFPFSDWRGCKKEQLSSLNFSSFFPFGVPFRNSNKNCTANGLQRSGKVFHLYPPFCENNLEFPHAALSADQKQRKKALTVVQRPHDHFSASTSRKCWSVGSREGMQNKAWAGLTADVDTLKGKEEQLFFKIIWQKNILSISNFVQQQLECNNWNTLFSLNEIHKERQEKRMHLRKKQYMECRKIALFYGNLPKRVLIRTMQHAQKEAHGGKELNSTFFSRLERRLDVCLKRISFFPTINMARQWIHQGKIWVNNQPCTVSTYLLQPADLLAIKPGLRQLWRREWHYYFNVIAISRLHKSLFSQESNTFLSKKILHQLGNTGSASYKKGKSRKNAPGYAHPQQNCKDDIFYFSIARGLEERFVGLGRKRNLMGEERKKKEKTNNRSKQFSASKGVHTLNVLISKKGLIWGNRHSPFSPLLMKKWRQWGELWGNCTASAVVLPTPVLFPHDNRRVRVKRKESLPFNGFYDYVHKWGGKLKNKGDFLNCKVEGKELKFRFKDLHPFFNTSCLYDFSEKSNNWLLSSPPGYTHPQVKGMGEATGAGGFAQSAQNQPQLIGRRKTAVTLWLKKFAMHHSSNLHNQWNARLFPRKNLRILRAKLLLAMLLHQQQTQVVDGLYSLRLNKLLIKGKSCKGKKRSWNFTCLKPLHLECSFKQGSAIFLYAPQKVAWPSNINVVWLQQHLHRR